MISLYPIIMLNVFGALEVLFPILLLYFLYRIKHISSRPSSAAWLCTLSSPI